MREAEAARAEAAAGPRRPGGEVRWQPAEATAERKRRRRKRRRERLDVSSPAPNFFDHRLPDCRFCEAIFRLLAVDGNEIRRQTSSGGGRSGQVEGCTCRKPILCCPRWAIGSAPLLGLATVRILRRGLTIRLDRVI